MPENPIDPVYEKLRLKINESPRMKMPKMEEIMKILQLRFTPEEAEIGCWLSPDYYQAATAEDVAASSGREVDYVRSALERMLAKGSIFWIDAAGEDRYCLMPVFGFFEIPFADGRTDPEARELADLWDDFFTKDSARTLSRSTYKWARVLPATTRTIAIDQQIETQSVILTWENVKEYLAAAVSKGRKLALVKCSCRVAFQNCDKPIDACIAVGSAAEFFLHRKKAIKQLNLEETLGVLKRNLLAGLVLTTNNMQYGFDFICSCCSCCCGLLRAHVEWVNPHVIEKSNYIPVIDRDVCSECGICVDVCQFGAWTEDLEFLSANCIGCGVCEVNCPAEAISLQKITNLVPEKNPHDMWKKISDTVFE